MLQRKALLIFAAILCCASPLIGKTKDRAWQTGKMLDSDRTHYYAGTVGSANATTYGTNQTSASGSTTAVYRVNQVYAIELGDYVYVSQERLKWRWSKPANVTVNGPVRVVIEKRKLFILDEEGKEHETEIIKKTLKTPDEKKP